eukprot:11206555-Lingulodinium_polyedra.AAC.1
MERVIARFEIRAAMLRRFENTTARRFRKRYAMMRSNGRFAVTTARKPSRPKTGPRTARANARL